MHKWNMSVVLSYSCMILHSSLRRFVQTSVHHPPTREFNIYAPVPFTSANNTAIELVLHNNRRNWSLRWHEKLQCVYHKWFRSMLPEDTYITNVFPWMETGTQYYLYKQFMLRRWRHAPLFNPGNGINENEYVTFVSFVYRAYKYRE